MTDPITTSRSAREALSRGLNALQADPTVPPQLVELAAPIAQAMGALHQLERSQQLAPHADVALGHVRGALAQLQGSPTGHPAVATALESVAQSLSLVHTLSRMASGPAQAPPPQAAPQAPPPQAAPQAPPPQAAPQQAAPQQAAPQANPNMGTAAMAQRAPAPQGPPPQAMQQPPMQAPPHAGPPQGYPQGGPPPQGYPGGAPAMVARDPFAATAVAPPGGAPPGFAPQGGPPMGSPPPGGQPATPSMPVPAPPAQGGTPLVAADLGAHSSTNFYKGLSGNDIIDHGGLFVSTYALPKINSQVRLKVSLPGGYEFEANAVVRWTREATDDAPPGFGAQFTAITPEARQLVYRYVRNREPLFHDDL